MFNKTMLLTIQEAWGAAALIKCVLVSDIIALVTLDCLLYLFAC